MTEVDTSFLSVFFYEHLREKEEHSSVFAVDSYSDDFQGQSYCLRVLVEQFEPKEMMMMQPK